MAVHRFKPPADSSRRQTTWLAPRYVLGFQTRSDGWEEIIAEKSATSAFSTQPDGWLSLSKSAAEGLTLDVRVDGWLEIG